MTTSTNAVSKTSPADILSEEAKQTLPIV